MFRREYCVATFLSHSAVLVGPFSFYKERDLRTKPNLLETFNALVWPTCFEQNKLIKAFSVPFSVQRRERGSYRVIPWASEHLNDGCAVFNVYITFSANMLHISLHIDGRSSGNSSREVGR